MAQQVAQAEALTGQARNPVKGGLVPHQVTNLAPDYQGGLTPFGRRVRLQDEDGDVTVPAPEHLIGHDETGIASFGEDGELALFLGRRLYPQHDDLPGMAAGAVHLDTAGAYADRDNFLVLSRQLAGGRVPVQPLSSSVAAVVGGGSPLQNDSMSINPIEVAYGDGAFIAISARAIHQRQADGSWQAVYEENDADVGDFTRVAFGGGTFLAAQGAADNEQGRVFASSDGGDNWTPATVPIVGRITALGHQSGSDWLVASYRYDLSRSMTARSVDGGANWIDGKQRDFSVLVDAVAFHNPLSDGATSIGDYLFLVEEMPAGHSDRADGFVAAAERDYWRAYWEFMAVSALDSADKYRFDYVAHRAVASERFVFTFHRDGRVNRSEAFRGTRQGAAVSKYAGVSEAGGTVTLRDAAYDPLGKALIAVGGFTPTGGGPAQARAWRSTDDGLSWSRMHEVEDALVTPIVTVAVNDDGDALYLNADTWAFSGVRRGLEGGEYNIITVSYFNTHAGRFVYDLSRETLTTEDGGSVAFRATGKDLIAANSPWVDPDGGPDYSAILDELRFDVYIQRVPSAIESDGVAVQPEATIRYAFTESFPDGDGMVDLARSIDALPLGRQLVVRGAPTTSVLESSLTALHQGRVWGMARQDESAWHVEDGISPEIANQANRFVLCYSEVGWANLLSDQSFIPIQPTQSTRFTGLLSTPFGLLVMFDNEIHVVTGDPAFDNVTVELFSDIVGCDVGAPPCKLGGQPFTVWQGKVWALTSGGAQEVSRSQWLPLDPFVGISPEPQNRSLLCLTEAGWVFRYIVDDQFWLTDPVTGPGTSHPMRLLLPNCVCEVGDNTRFVNASGHVYVTRRDGAPDTPYILWQNLDFGLPERRKALHLAKLAFEGYEIFQQVFDRSDPAWNPTAVPHLTVLTLNDVIASIPPILRYPGEVADRGMAVLSWRTPVGLAKSDAFNLLLGLAGLDYGDTIKLPLKLFFSAGGELR